MRASIALALLLTACGSSSSPSSPTPPAPVQVTVTAALTETLTGATVGATSQNVDRLPALLTFSQPGYVSRQAYVGEARPTVDLIKDAAPFDMGFYRQLVRNGLESLGALQPLQRLKADPSIYLQTNGISTSNVAALEQAARAIIPIWSGGQLSVAAFQSGPDLRPDAPGWITVETIFDATATAVCGRANVGAAAGHIWLDVAPELQDQGRAAGCYRPLAQTFSHELGHALGYWHVADPSCLMSVSRPLSHNGQPCAAERYHASIAYSRQNGNMDPDRDATTSTPLSLSRRTIVVD